MEEAHLNNTDLYAFTSFKMTKEKDLHSPKKPHGCAPGQSCKDILHGTHH